MLTKKHAMLFARLISLAMAGAAATAAPNYENRQRDLGTIQTALGQINTALESLDTAILSGTAGLSLLGAAFDVLHCIQSADMQVQASQALNVTDTSNLKATTDSLTINVNVTISDLIRAQPTFQQQRSTGAVLKNLLTIKTAAVQLANDLASKLPTDLSAIGSEGINNFVNAVDRGIAVYNGSVTDLGAALAPAAAPPSLSTAVSSVVASSTISTPVSTAIIATTPQASALVTTSPPQNLTTTPGTPPASQAVATPSSPSFGGISLPMPILGTFIDGVTCQCMCPGMAVA